MTEPSRRIEPCADTGPYFHAEVSQAADSLGIDSATVAIEYLARMLAGMAAERPEGSARVTTPLADLLAWSLNADQVERPHRLRFLGDVSLLICGFFPESFERRGLSYGYVSEMGRGAYEAAEAAIAARLGVRGGVFGMLAAAFGAHVRILDEVAERTALRRRGDIAALYERWVRSGSPRIAERLARAGLQATRPRGSVH